MPKKKRRNKNKMLGPKGRDKKTMKNRIEVEIRRMKK